MIQFQTETDVLIVQIIFFYPDQRQFFIPFEIHTRSGTHSYFTIYEIIEEKVEEFLKGKDKDLVWDIFGYSPVYKKVEIKSSEW